MPNTEAALGYTWLAIFVLFLLPFLFEKQIWAWAEPKLANYLQRRDAKKKMSRNH